MKARLFYLALAVAFTTSFYSCNKDNGVETDPINPIVEEGLPTTINLKISQPATYATVDANATEAEAELKTVDVFIYKSSTGDLVDHAQLSAGDFTQGVSSDGKNDKYEAIKDVETTTGEKSIYVGVNLSTNLRTVLLNGNIAAIKTAQTVAVNDLTNTSSGFVMFSHEDIKKVLVEDGNDINVEVARLVAKVSIHEGQNINSSTTGGSFENLEFTLGNINTKEYPRQQVNGSSIVIDPNWADGSWVSSDFLAVDPSAYVAINPYAEKDINKFNVKYTPENTSEMYYEKESTYASIKATFLPEEVLVKDGNEFKAATPTMKSGDDFWVVADPDNGYLAYFEDENVASEYKSENGGDLRKYENGQCYYVIFLNPKGTFNVLRNEYYKINITEISGLGYPNPNTQNPDEQIETDTTIKFTIEVLAWTLVEDDVKLRP